MDNRNSMMKHLRVFSFLVLVFSLFSGITVACNSVNEPDGAMGNKSGDEQIPQMEIRPAAERTEAYFRHLKDKKIAIVANPSSLVGNVHLLDTLLGAGFDVNRVLAPEHGFRGKAEAGEHVESGTDSKTGVKVVSLYGRNRKPSTEDLQGVDMVIFDLQDVGVRFYTYVSTMHYVMEKCAEMGITFMVLDRPNPNGFYIDGPVLDEKYKSFIGMHKVPLVHGMTLGEFALMINGEGWLNNGMKADLKVIPVDNYTHDSFYELPVAPSPNLPNMKSVYLYPSLGLFEGTMMSIGRGTDFPFQVIGHPALDTGSFYFTPRSIPGASKYPKHEGNECRGWDLRDTALALRDQKKLHLGWIMSSYKLVNGGNMYFKNFFYKLSGNELLRKKIEEGWTEEQIRQSWQKDINDFKKIRRKYLLYPDFE